MHIFNRITSRSAIASKLLAWFLLISLVPMLAMVYLVSLQSSKSLEELIRLHLQSVANTKAEQIERFATEKLRGVTALSRIPTVAEAIREFNGAVDAAHAADPDAYKAAVRKFGPVLGSYGDSFGFSDVMLVSLDGDVLWQSDDRFKTQGGLVKGELKGTELGKVFDRARTLLQAELSDFQSYETQGLDRPAAFVAGPVMDQGAVIGVVVFRLSNDGIYSIVNDYIALGETGEVIVGAKVDQSLMVVAPLRYRLDAAFNKEFPISADPADPLQQATRGVQGFGAGKDYRGVDTMAAWKYVPAFRWGIVIKQNRDEALSLVYKQQATSFWLSAAAILIAILMADLVARSISVPIRKSAAVANRIAGGDLTGELSSLARDETGQLIRSMQVMNQNLASLVGHVKYSTQQLVDTATRIAISARRQETTVQDFHGSSSQIAASTREISATSHELVRTMDQVGKIVKESTATASIGLYSLNEMDLTTRSLAEATDAIAEKLTQISERASAITLVVTTITKVADQTNMLSVNASIEAQKAGKYGAGFRVVAHEIRRLADQTAVATLEIETMVDQMQNAVKSGVNEMEKFNAQVHRNMVQVAQVSNQMGEIIQGVQSLALEFHRVGESVRMQDQGAQQISDAMAHLSQGAARTVDALKEYETANQDLRLAVEVLRGEVSKFKTE